MRRQKTVEQLNIFRKSPFPNNRIFVFACLANLSKNCNEDDIHYIIENIFFDNLYN